MPPSKTVVLGYLLLLCSAIGLGLTNFLFPRASKALGASNATFFYYVFALLLALSYWLPTREAHWPRGADWQWPLYLALAMFVSNVTYSYATQSLGTTFPAVIRALSFFITGLLALYFNRETLTPTDWVALALVAAGIVLFAYGRASP